MNRPNREYRSVLYECASCGWYYNNGEMEGIKSSKIPETSVILGTIEVNLCVHDYARVDSERIWSKRNYRINVN